MKEFFLRRSWPLPERILYYVLFILLIASAIMLVITRNAEGSPVFPMDTSLVPDFVKIRLYSFLTPFGDFSPEVNSIINFQKFVADGFVMPVQSVRIFWVLFFVVSSIITAIIIRLSKWWFFIGLSLIIVFLAYFNIQEFGILGAYDNYFLIACIAFAVGVVFLTHNYLIEKPFAFHFLVSAGLWSVIWGSVLLFGEGQEIVFRLGNMSLMASFLIVVIFLILIGHEPIHVFFTMISYSSNRVSTGRLVNFIILSLLYLGNVALSYFHNIGKLDIELLYTPHELLLIFAILCGFYGFGKRFNSKEVFGSHSAGIILYTALSAFTIGLLVFGHYSGHDAINEIMEDATFYTQLGMGGIFFFYLIINFGDMLRENVKAYKVVYQPKRFTMLTAMGGGLVIILAMFMRSGMFPYYQMRGVSYTAMADNYLVNGDLNLAEVFYEEGAVFAYDNRRSNASLALLYKEQQRMPAYAVSMKKALLRNPIPIHFLDLSESFEKNDKYFDALFQLQAGVRTFPESEPIANNLGLLFTKSNAYDSAFYYFNRSDDISRERNLSAMLSKSGYFNPDSLPEMTSKDLAEMANRITIFSKSYRNFREEDIPDMLIDSVISFDEFTFFYNLTLNKILTGEDLNRERIDELINYNITEDYKRDLHLLRGLDHFRHNRISEAVEDFSSAEYYSGITGPVISNLTGTLLWSRKLYKAAEERLERASRVGYADAPLKLFYFYVETGDAESASFLFNRNIVRNFIPDSLEEQWSAILSGDYNTEDLSSESGEMVYSSLKLHPAKWSNDALTDVPDYFSSDAFKDRVAADVLEILAERKSGVKGFFTKWNESLKQPIALQEAYLRYVFNNEPEISYVEAYEKIQPAGQSKDLFDAWYYRIKGDSRAFRNSADAAKHNSGYDPEVVLLGIESLKEQNVSEDSVYEELVRQIQVYPEHPGLAKAYALQATEMGYDSYAEMELEKLQDLLTPEAYESFMGEIRDARAAYQKEQDW
jgi:hypothetical protein